MPQGSRNLPKRLVFSTPLCSVCRRGLIAFACENNSAFRSCFGVSGCEEISIAACRFKTSIAFGEHHLVGQMYSQLPRPKEAKMCTADQAVPNDDCPFLRQAPNARCITVHLGMYVIPRIVCFSLDTYLSKSRTIAGLERWGRNPKCKPCTLQQFLSLCCLLINRSF